MKFNNLSRRTHWCAVILLLVLCIFGPSAFSQSVYGPYNIPVNSCGPTSYSDFRNTAGYQNNVGYPSPEVCYSFTIAQATNVNVSLCGSDFDTYLMILNQSGTVLYSNDDDGILCTGSTKSSLSQILQAGTYIIVAEGYSSATGSIALDVQIQGGGSSAPGSGMAGAINMGTFNGSGTFNDARSNANPCLGNNFGQPGNDIFYRFVLTGSSSVELMHCGSGFDTYMYLLDQWGNEITHNDDNSDSPSCPGSESYLRTTLPAGTYYVVSEGYGNNTGTINTTINVGSTGSSGPPVISYTNATSLQLGTAATLSPVNTGGAVLSVPTAVGLAAGSGSFNSPLGTAVDGQGNVYVADADNHRIKKISPSGVVSVLAGSGVPGYADGPGSSAQFTHPSALVVDVSGNVYVSDQQNHRIRKISPSGNVSTVAGAGYAGYADGNGTTAVFSSPIGLALDASGNLYVADYSNNRIRKITPAGAVSTYAGNGASGFSNGTVLSSSFRNPMGLSFDGTGNLYVADRLNHSVRKITPSGTVSTVAGSGSAGYVNGSGTGASFNYPNGVTSDASGNIYVADQQNNRVRKISVSGLVSTLAGSGSASTVNGTGAAISFNAPYGLSIDANGILYIAESAGNAVRKVTTGGYNISPVLPVGLNLDPVTGTISGTPTTLSPMTTYTVTAYGTTGNGTTSLSMEVTSGGACVTPSLDQNYVITYTPRERNMTTATSVVSSSCNKDLVQTGISYFDGLGRPMQEVNVKGNGNGDRDVVVPRTYDQYGRENFDYLPYAATGSSQGGHRPSAVAELVSYYGGQPVGSSIAFTTPFSEKRFEASPLNRLLEQGAPGASWQIGAGHTVRNTYETNLSGEVNYWEVSGSGASISGTYSPGKLYKNKVIDENNHERIDYIDQEGNVVLKRVQADVGYLSTYYIYDDFGNLRFVVPPKVTLSSFDENSSIFPQYIYAYTYDARNRQVRKKIPGKGWENMVYNNLDQLVGTQDSKQALSGLWTFNKYDAFKRVIQIGEVSDSRDRTALATFIETLPCYEIVNNTTTEGYSQNSWPTTWNKLYQVNYYDGYTFPNHPGTDYNSTATEVTLTMSKGLLTGSKIRNLSSGEMLWTLIYYDTKGRVRESISQNHIGGKDRVVNSYNFTSAITNSVRTHSSSSVPSLIITNTYTYDHMGRRKHNMQQTGSSNPTVLISDLEYDGVGKLLHKRLHSNLQDISYTYNERGWLNSTGSQLFSETLRYANPSHGASPQFNGNISEQEYYAPIGGNQFVTYGYDALDRLKFGNSSAGYSETGITYDEMGNILTLNRQSKGSLAYSNYDGNRLSAISGYRSGSFSYDANGSLSSDGMRGINITYNFLNLPELITGARNIQYNYDATGKKLSRSSNSLGTIDYIDGIQYDSGVLSSVQTEEGRAIKSGSGFNYEYSLTDHLNNNRVTFDTSNGSANKVGEEEYYPLGLNQHRQTNAGNQYLYNKKELQEELEEYDYGARFYDPVIGRWNVVDPLSELSRRWSPYNYANNNSMRFIDPDGRFTIDSQGNEHSENAEEAQAMFKSLQNNTGDPGKKKEKKKEQVGSYTITFKSGKKYHGKGPLSRANLSAKEKAREYDDPAVDIEWVKAEDDKQAFKDEDDRIKSDEGGHKSDNNYNKRKSPGDKIKEKDKQKAQKGEPSNSLQYVKLVTLPVDALKVIMPTKQDFKPTGKVNIIVTGAVAAAAVVGTVVAFMFLGG